MENSLLVRPIGTVRASGDGFRIEVSPSFRPALMRLDAFGWVQILWWFSGCDDPASRATLQISRPYIRGPERLGVFSTRSPQRPNPLAVSCAQVLCVDPARGAVDLAYLDAADGTPVLDLKPYTPSLDRVERPGGPDWCAHWPGSVEASGAFDWSSEFAFESQS